MQYNIAKIDYPFKRMEYWTSLHNYIITRLMNYTILLNKPIRRSIENIIVYSSDKCFLGKTKIQMPKKEKKYKYLFN